jgi:predicted amidohydrolase
VTIRIAQVRAYPRKGALDANAAELMSVLRKLGEQKPDVAVTPEGFLDGYIATEEHITRENIADRAIDPATSPCVAVMCEWAAEHSAWLVVGCARKADDGVYNSALIINRSGELAGTYDKTHLQTHDLKYEPGQALPVFDSDFGTFGVMICADRRWPETVRTLALKGARVIFNPTWGMYDARNLHMMQTRSYESEAFIAFTHPGQSLITGPRGEIVVNDDSSETRFTITEIDLAEVDAVRSEPHSHLKGRRPELYL